MGFDRDGFVSECASAVKAGDPLGAGVGQLLERAISDPNSIEAEIGDRTTVPSMIVWHRSDEMTIFHMVWPPGVDLFAHDHNMWAAIGVYGGREDNQFYDLRPDGRIEPSTGKTLTRGDTANLGIDVVHSVSNPTREWSAAIHVYGGDYFAVPRTMWRGDTLEPAPLDSALISQAVELAAESARTTSERNPEV